MERSAEGVEVSKLQGIGLKPHSFSAAIIGSSWRSTMTRFSSSERMFMLIHLLVM